jgi:hypothetical protein
MANWHQQRNPVRYWHETQWTVLVNPPNEGTSLYRTSDEAGAREYLRNLHTSNPRLAQHASILRPASVTA